VQCNQFFKKLKWFINEVALSNTKMTLAKTFGVWMDRIPLDNKYILFTGPVIVVGTLVHALVFLADDVGAAVKTIGDIVVTSRPRACNRVAPVPVPQRQPRPVPVPQRQAWPERPEDSWTLMAYRPPPASRI
jgi:hypothetical protein